MVLVYQISVRSIGMELVLVDSVRLNVLASRHF